MAYDTLSVDHDDGITTITLDRPDSRNALSPQMLDDLRLALKDTVQDTDSRGVVLTGNGDAFSAGADLSALQGMDEGDARALSEQAEAVTRRLERSRLVTAAAIDGPCLGGGHELALACDFRVATADATFGQPEVRLGLIPGFGGAARLARLVGLARAKSLVLTGHTIGAEEASRIGLVDEVVDDAIEAAHAVVTDTVEATSPTAYRHAKRVLARTFNHDLQEAVKHERDEFSALFGSADAEEGIAAFLEGRDPAFGDAE